MNTPTPQKSPMELMQEAQMTITSIKKLIEEENLVMARNQTQLRMQQLEDTLPEKKKLSIRLEHILNTLKTHKDTIKEDPTLKATAHSLNKNIESFKDDALQNLTKLRAAHQIRADFITMVKDTVMKLDANQTYGANGSMSHNTGPTRTVMEKSV